MTTQPPPRAWPGDCLICGNYKQQVRHVETPGHPRIQACFDCRPGEAPPQVRKFAVQADRAGSFLIEATSREEATAFLNAELDSTGDADVSAFWEASSDPHWLAAWRRGAVIVIRDRRLPENLE